MKKTAERNAKAHANGGMFVSPFIGKRFATLTRVKRNQHTKKQGIGQQIHHQDKNVEEFITSPLNHSNDNRSKLMLNKSSEHFFDTSDEQNHDNNIGDAIGVDDINGNVGDEININISEQDGNYHHDLTRKQPLYDFNDDNKSGNSIISREAHLDDSNNNIYDQVRRNTRETYHNYDGRDTYQRSSGALSPFLNHPPVFHENIDNNIVNHTSRGSDCRYESLWDHIVSKKYESTISQSSNKEIRQNHRGIMPDTSIWNNTNSGLSQSQTYHNWKDEGDSISIFPYFSTVR